MKFYPNKALRYVGGYGSMFLLIAMPVWLSVELRSIIVPGEENLISAACLFLALCGGILFNYAFLEKCFSSLILTNEEIRWKCPFRKDRVIRVADCFEIGAYLENENNGIPSEQIYFSDHTDPKKRMGKNGVMKSSQHLIKCYYTNELCSYLLENYSGQLTSCLYAYRQERRKRY